VRVAAKPKARPGDVQDKEMARRTGAGNRARGQAMDDIRAGGAAGLFEIVNVAFKAFHPVFDFFTRGGSKTHTIASLKILGMPQSIEMKWDV
jgi:hypothetical protein